MTFLGQHRLVVAIVAAAYAAAMAVYLFGRPQYHSHVHAQALVFPEAKAPDHGWTWADGTPGFRFGQDRNKWNVSELRTADLAPARRAAPAAGVDPQSVRVLQVLRTQQGVRPQVLLAGSDSSGGTCIGVQLHAGPTSFTCAPELDRAVAVLVADAPTPRGSSHGMFLMGVSRADVTRVTVTTLGSTYLDARHTKPLVRKTGAEVVYERGPAGWWGTFLKTTAQPRRWHAHVVFYGKRGRLAAVDVRFARAGERAVVAR